MKKRGRESEGKRWRDWDIKVRGNSSTLVCVFTADQCSNFEAQCSRIVMLFDWSFLAFHPHTSFA